MDDELILSDNTDDDRALNDGFSSSITSDDDDDDETCKMAFLPNSSKSFLSNEDINKCLYITNINWRQRFSVS
jgi:hypothetical protein